MLQRPTTTRAFSMIELEREISDDLNPEPIAYAPPAVRSPTLPLPVYVNHRDGVSNVGQLSAEAVVQEYEQAAKEIEAAGAELLERVHQIETMKADALTVIAEMKDCAQRYRDEGKRLFLQIEDCSIMTQEVRQACVTLKEKVVVGHH